MRSTTLAGYRSPTIESTERSNGHLMPAAVAVVLALITTIVSMLIVGLPH
jgi:hypothetical protein